MSNIDSIIRAQLNAAIARGSVEFRPTPEHKPARLADVIADGAARTDERWILEAAMRAGYTVEFASPFARLEFRTRDGKRICKLHQKAGHWLLEKELTEQEIGSGARILDGTLRWDGAAWERR